MAQIDEKTTNPDEMGADNTEMEGLNDGSTDHSTADPVQLHEGE